MEKRAQCSIDLELLTAVGSSLARSMRTPPIISPWALSVHSRNLRVLAFKRSNPAGKIVNVNVAAFHCQVVECHIEVEQVFLVQATWTFAAEDVLCKLLGVLGANKLLVVRGADVDESFNRRRAISGLKRGIVYRVAIDLSDVQVLLHFGDLFGHDPVGHTPYLVGGLIMMVHQLFPVRPLNQGDDPARSFRGASMILTFRQGQYGSVLPLQS